MMDRLTALTPQECLGSPIATALGSNRNQAWLCLSQLPSLQFPPQLPTLAFAYLTTSKFEGEGPTHLPSGTKQRQF